MYFLVLFLLSAKSDILNDLLVFNHIPDWDLLFPSIRISVYTRTYIKQAITPLSYTLVYVNILHNFPPIYNVIFVSYYKGFKTSDNSYFVEFSFVYLRYSRWNAFLNSIKDVRKSKLSSPSFDSEQEYCKYTQAACFLMCFACLTLWPWRLRTYVPLKRRAFPDVNDVATKRKCSSSSPLWEP
jgi:hypothetical protein